MRTMACVVVMGLWCAGAAANYTDENWNHAGAGNNLWSLWDTSFNGGGSPNDHNRPLAYLTSGGYANSGHVRSDLRLCTVAMEHQTARAYWPAYPGEDEVPHFPPIDLNVPNAAISIMINDVGPTPANLGGGAVHFFIGYYDGKGTEQTDDDEQAFFCTKGAFAIHPGSWQSSVVALGGDSDWYTIVIDEQPGPATTPTDLYTNPQQWGFVIYQTAVGAQPTGLLGWDEFHLIPEPLSITVLAVGGWALLRRRQVALP